MEERVTYVTFVGRSEWAVVNSFHAVLFHEEIDIDELHLIYKSSDEEKMEKCVDGLEEVIRLRGMDCEIVVQEVEDEFDIRKPASEVKKVMEESEEVVIDITPARKFMASTALIGAVKNDVDSVYYLYIDSVEDADRPYLDIPLPRQELLELMEVRTVV